MTIYSNTHHTTTRAVRAAHPVRTAHLVRVAHPVRAAHPAHLALFVLGSLLLAFSCAPASGEALSELEGYLFYRLEDRTFVIGTKNVFGPRTRPSIPNTDTSDARIRYNIARRDRKALRSNVTINETNGIVTVDSTTESETDPGTTSYFVQAEALGYAIQLVSFNITIIDPITIQGKAYHSEVTDVFPIEVGQAIKDSGAFALADNTAIFSLSGLISGEEYTIHFGTEVGNYSEDYQKTASNGAIAILKFEADLANNFFSFADGTVMGLSGLGILGTRHVATYHPSNIYGYQDLQAMRYDLAQDYILKNDIEFPPKNADAPSVAASNYEAVGSDSNPFTGSLDGAGYAVTGVEMVGFNTDNYQGLFGVVEAGAVDTIAVQNLVLRDFKITGNAYVGSLAGWVKRGTVDGVSVAVSTPDAGKIEVRGDVSIDRINRGYGGGLIGRAGTDAADIQVRVQNASSEIAIIGSGEDSDRIGGLIGDVSSDAMLTESSATGSVTSTASITGGLVGYNLGTVIGYATGSVEGRGRVGGLIGETRGTATGYATGAVIGIERVGGLTGENSGTATGYATGVVTGNDNLGGLVGYNGGTATGYARGDVIGTNRAAGLIGTSNANGITTGYTRSAVRRSQGTEIIFKKTISADAGTSIVFSSKTENKIYDGIEGDTILIDMTSNDGVEILFDASTTLATFAGFTFGTAVAEWIWVAGKWPAINIGDELKLAADQPVDP